MVAWTWNNVEFTLIYHIVTTSCEHSVVFVVLLFWYICCLLVFKSFTFRYVCGSSLAESEDKRNPGVFTRENINCRVVVETPYFGIDGYPKVCVQCGRKGTLMPHDSNFLPQCNTCKNVKRIINRKRKAVNVIDFGKKKKWTVWTDASSWLRK